jgi:hypothetical protein
MRLPPALSAAFAFSLLHVPPAHAARPMITDDARIVDGKACQVESWVRNNRGSREFWALPACNPTGNAELTFGGARTRYDGDGSAMSDVQMQAKTIFRPLETNDWGAGLAVGFVRHPNLERGDRAPGDFYWYVPASYSFLDDKVVAHTNLGYLHRKADARDLFTWGVAAETLVNPHLYVITEAFGQQSGNPFYQLGLRIWIVPNRVQVDTTYGNRFGSGTNERWFSIGFRLLSPPFLPW